MVDMVREHHVDMNAANKDRLVAAQQAAGIPYTNVTHNYDQSTHNAINQQDVHNQAMAMLQNHAAQFGTCMNQHRMTQEAMLHLLFEHIRTNKGEPRELNITILGGSGPPQPPGGGGAIAKGNGSFRKVRLRGKQKPKPYDKGPGRGSRKGRPGEVQNPLSAGDAADESS